MLIFGFSKLRLIGLIILCIIIWKTIYFFLQLNPDQFLSIRSVNNSFRTLSENSVLVSIYYEALCSDSRNFILKQLVPVYEKIPHLIDVDLIPYGKATTIEENGTYKFECQHSYIECEANKIHACVLNQQLPRKLQLKYVACMIQDNMIPHDVGKKCAEELDVDYSPIEECANGKEGSLLLKDYGIRTHAVSPKITFIPTVQINKSSQVPLVYILKDLFKEVCKALENKQKTPKECL